MSNPNNGVQAVTDYLRQMLNTHMNTTEVSLDFRALTDLLPIIHLLGSFKRMKKLSLHGNRLRELPTDMSRLVTLETLDISNNFLDDNIQLTVMSLKTLPALKNLIYPVPAEKQQKIVEQLKKLQYFNNIKIERKQAKKEIVFNYLNKKTMDEFESKLCEHYKILVALEEKYLDDKEDKFSLQKFKQDISIVSKEYLQRMARSKDQTPPPSLQHVMVSMAKYEMFDQIQTKAMNLCQDIYGDLGDFMIKLYAEQMELFKSLSQQSLNLTRLEYDVREQNQMQKRMSEQNGDYLVLNKNLTMQKEIKRLRKQKEELISELNSVEAQNKKLMDALMKYAKGDKSVLSNFNGHHSKENKFSKTEESFAQQGGSTSRGIPMPVIRSGQKSMSFRGTTTKDLQNLQSNYSTGGGGGNRNLTLKQLKQIIEEIYESKLKFDQKNYDGKIARQTMHQYLFTYLNQKYGLKNLTIEAAGSIVSGIQAYSAEDNDICVFGKILRNEIDEQFRFVQTELKTTVTDLLKMHIKTKMPYKSATEVNEILNEKMNNEIAWQEAEDIVKYLYNKSDSQAILKKLDVLFNINQKPRDEKSISRRLTREQQSTLMNQKQVRKLRFSQFLKCVLDFQLKNHQKLLKPLVRSFKNKDADSDGIIDEEEFISIVQDLCEQGNDIVPYLLNIVDPYEIKQITFTQMVRLVANYPQSRPILSRFIGNEEEELQRFGEQDQGGNQHDDDNQ